MKKKVKCHTCGHFNMIRTDHGWLKGCSVFSLMLEEMRNEFVEQDEEGNIKSRTDVTIAPIDSQFTLNKNGFCEFWTRQTPEQEQALREIKVWRRKHFIRNIINKFRRSHGRAQQTHQPVS